jgi:uncharacterized membrane protein
MGRSRSTYARISAILFFGSFCAAALLAVGLGMLWLGGYSREQLISSVRPSPSGMISDLVAGDPVAIVKLGILVMMVTPFLRVVAAIFSFLLERDYRYAAIGMGVMTILLFTILPILY